MHEIHDYKRQGLNLSQISALTGYSRPTIRKYLAETRTPQYGPRAPRVSGLDPYKSYLQERLAVGVWNATVLHREIQQRGYTGCYSVLKRYLQPLRKEAQVVAVRRFETPPGHQAQVDWGDLGDLTDREGIRHPLNGFVLTLGYSRAMFSDIATDQKLPAFVRMHEAAFDYLGGVPQEILYDNTKTVVLRLLTQGVDGRGETRLNPAFADFARYWGFQIRLCRPYRPQTKGKVESGVRYLRQNFLCGRTANDLTDLRQQMQHWLGEVANVRVHGSTHRIVREAWEEEKPALQPAHHRRAFPLVVECLRQVSRDAFVSYKGNRYSVPWQQAGRQVLVREIGNTLEIVRDEQTLACHVVNPASHQVVCQKEHPAGIPTPTRRLGKTRLQLTEGAPQVEERSLRVYEEVA